MDQEWPEVGVPALACLIGSESTRLDLCLRPSIRRQRFQSVPSGSGRGWRPQSSLVGRVLRAVGGEDGDVRHSAGREGEPKGAVRCVEVWPIPPGLRLRLYEGEWRNITAGCRRRGLGRVRGAMRAAGDPAWRDALSAPSALPAAHPWPCRAPSARRVEVASWSCSARPRSAPARPGRPIRPFQLVFASARARDAPAPALPPRRPRRRSRTPAKAAQWSRWAARAARCCFPPPRGSLTPSSRA